MLTERLTFRLTPEDLDHVVTISGTLRDSRGGPFVSRSDVLRAALRVAAEAVSKGAV